MTTQNENAKPVKKGCSVWIFLGAVVVIGIACWAALGLIGGGGNTADTKHRDAFIACKIYLEDRLKAPSTAKWPNSSEATYTEGEYGTLIVKAWVDAQNSFGAMIRTTWTCKTNNGAVLDLQTE